MAQFFTKHLGEGQKRVAIIAHNSIRQLALIQACFLSGHIACPINWRLSARELSSVIRTGSFAIAFYDRQTADVYSRATKISGVFLPGFLLDDFKPEGSDTIREWPVQLPEAIAIQYFTSGSTGKPKGVIHTHGSMEKYTETYTRISEWKEDDVYESLANLFHLSGFSCLISLYVGCTMIMLDRYNEEEFYSYMEREKCTRVSMMPVLVVQGMADKVSERYRLDCVKKIVYGGSSMPLPQVKVALKDFRCGMEQAYGATETCCISVLNEQDHIDCMTGAAPFKRLESAGRPLPGVTVHIVNKAGEVVQPMEIGEITVKSPFLFSGYTNVNCNGITQAGFYHTGDLGYADPDGYIYIVDRKDDMIISGGENVYPREVENCISMMENDVESVAVVGAEDEIWGQSINAFIVKKQGSRLTENDVIRFCREHIAGYKKPRNVFFLDRMPLNANSKIDKKALRKILS